METFLNLYFLSEKVPKISEKISFRNFLRLFKDILKKKYLVV